MITGYDFKIENIWQETVIFKARGGPGQKSKSDTKQVKLMWTPEALSLFMIYHPYLDSLNDVEIYNALKNYSRL